MPRVYIGELPPKRKSGAAPVAGSDRGGEGGEDFPYILVRSIDGDIPTENPRTQRFNVGMLCGIFSADGSAESGTHDILNMIDMVVFVLGSHLYWADDSWKMVMPINWNCGIDKRATVYENAGQQTPPFFGGAVFASFEANAPVFEHSKIRRQIADAM